MSTTYNFTLSGVDLGQVEYQVDNLSLSANPIIDINYTDPNGTIYFTNNLTGSDTTQLNNYFSNYTVINPSEYNINMNVLYGITANLNINSSTNTQTFTFPDIGSNVTDTMVMQNYSQSMTNKTITDPSNNVSAMGLLYDGNGSTSGTMNVYTSVSGPSPGQCLLALSSSAAHWGNLGVGSLVNSTNQSISSGSNTTLTLGTVGIASTNSADITLNTSSNSVTAILAGVYHVSGSVNWTSTPGTGTYQLYIAVNGSNTYGTILGIPGGLTVSLAAANTLPISAYLNLSANSVITLVVNQNSGSSQIISGGGVNAAHLFIKRVS